MRQRHAWRNREKSPQENPVQTCDVGNRLRTRACSPATEAAPGLVWIQSGDQSCALQMLRTFRRCQPAGTARYERRIVDVSPAAQRIGELVVTERGVHAASAFALGRRLDFSSVLNFRALKRAEARAPGDTANLGGTP